MTITTLLVILHNACALNEWQALGKYHDHTQRKEGEREREGGREGEGGRDGKRMKYIYYKYMVCMHEAISQYCPVLHTFLPHALYRERLQDMMLVLTMDTETTGKRERKIIKNPTLYVEFFDVIKLHVF